MGFNANVNLSDANQGSDPQDAYVVQALYDALGAWSNYIDGVGTLNVKLVVRNLGAVFAGSEYTIATGGPTDFSYGPGGPQGKQLGIPSSVVALDTGNHIADSDITITYNASLLGSLGSDQAPGLVTVMEHELEHGFGMVGFYPGIFGFQTTTTTASSYDTHVGFGSGFFGGSPMFTGTAAEIVYGGPVPLTAFTGSSNIYHLGEYASASDPQALRDDLMYPYLLNPNASISALDLAILKDSAVPVSANGTALLDAATPLTAATGSANGVFTSDALVSGRAPANAAIGIYEGTTLLGYARADANGNWSFRANTLADGFHQLTATTLGAGGDYIDATAGLLLDATDPVLTFTQQLLGLAPSAATLAAERLALVDGGSFASLRPTIAHSPDSIAALQAAYQAIVGRTPTLDEYSRNQNELQNGSTVAAIRAALLASAEEPAAIQRLFQNAVGRPAGPADIARVQADIGAGGSLPADRAVLAASAEAQSSIQSAFLATVARAPSAADLARVQAELAAGGSIV